MCVCARVRAGDVGGAGGMCCFLKWKFPSRGLMFAPVNCAVLSVWLLTKFTKRIETWEISRDIFI